MAMGIEQKQMMALRFMPSILYTGLLQTGYIPAEP